MRVYETCCLHGVIAISNCDAACAARACDITITRVAAGCGLPISRCMGPLPRQRRGWDPPQASPAGAARRRTWGPATPARSHRRRSPCPRRPVYTHARHSARWHGVALLVRVGVPLKPEIHRVDPRIWVNSEALIGIFSQTAGSTCEFWVNPVNFTFRHDGGRPRGDARHGRA